MYDTNSDPLADVDFGTFSYGDPYPAAQEIRSASVFFFTYPTIEGTPKSGTSCAVQVKEPMTGAPADLVPTISPPRSLTVDAVAPIARQVNYDISLTPTLSWSAPAVGAPTFYDVDVQLIEGPQHDPFLGAMRMAILTTSATTVSLPPGILVPDSYYQIVVKAAAAPGTDFATTPDRRGYSVPYASADLISPVLATRPPP